MENNHQKDNLAIEMINITKSFLNGKVVANDNVNLNVKKNEIHAIIGENGAGKSVLMSMLFGVYSPDSGTIKINGKQVNFESAKDATNAGLGMVHQHFKLIDEFTVWENVILGVEGVGGLEVIKQKEIKEKLQELIDRYNFKLNVNKKVKELSVGQQQKIEILKLLYRNVDILIFDEPTAVLSEDEIESFLKMMLYFKEQGKTIIIITHKLSEIKSVADTGTVIRRGVNVDSFKIADKSIDEIAESMVGHKLDTVKNDQKLNVNAPIKFRVKNLNVYDQWFSSVYDEPFLEKLKKKFNSTKEKTTKLINKLSSKNVGDEQKEPFSIKLKNKFNDTKEKVISLFTKKSQNETVEKAKSVENIDLIPTEPNTVNFSIREGEIFAIAGVGGNGQSELALMLAGMLPTHKAKIILNGEDISKLSTDKKIKAGISSIPEDRHKHGLILDMPVDKNTVLDQLDDPRFSKFGLLNHSSINQHGIDVIKKYDIRGTSRGTTAARLLSGGNQQKLIIGREMEKEHELLILVQPTRGMDLGAINFIHQQILEEKRNKKAILLISYELDEILALADTIAVMQNAKFLAVDSVDKMTKNRIGELMAGKE